MSNITLPRATVEQVLETIEGLTSDRLFTAEWAGKHGATITALRAALAQPVSHGCHVDVDHGMKPDGCVLDDGRLATGAQAAMARRSRRAASLEP